MCLTALGLAAVTSVSAQAPDIDWSGLAFLDYQYFIADANPEVEGTNSFEYRRIYLTATTDLSPEFRARVRLEAQGRATTQQGRPVPSVKDAWVRWEYAESGHRATLGVQPPPLFQISERAWGYRSLERTLIDRTRLRNSRDTGFRLDGPIVGDLEYSAMIGNGSGARPEAVGDRGKDYYVQLAYRPGEIFRASLGGDYRERNPDDLDGETSATVSGFVGAVTEGGRLGVEAFYVHNEFGGDVLPDQDGVGVSVFAVANLTDQTSVIARYDYADDDVGVTGVDEHYVLAAFAYRPIPRVSLMPNVIVTMPDGADATVLGRVTADVRF